MTDPRERIEELAALAAAGGATGTERAELDALAAADPEVRAMVREYGDAASLMALALDEPPPPARVLDAVRMRVRGRTPAPGVTVPAAERRGPAGGAPVVPIDSRRGRKPSPTVVAAVAVPLAAAAAFAFLWMKARGETRDAAGAIAELAVKLDEAERRERLAAGAMVAAQKKLEQLQGSLDALATPHLQLATVPAVAPDKPSIKVLADPVNRRWVVMAFDLPPIPSDKDYQLWFMPAAKGAAPVPAGLLAPGPGSSQFGMIAIPSDVTNIKGAAISVEPKGGSKAPTVDQIKVHGDLNLI
ncbi:MAG TPA: anti-sigma factor [Kofleriaceae bacterium]|nr:anti-sigma factor [Kofleriaceae bacterium]